MRVDCDLVIQPSISNSATTASIYVPTLREAHQAILYIDGISFTGGDSTSQVHSILFDIVNPASFKSNELNFSIRYAIQSKHTEDSQAFQISHETGSVSNVDQFQLKAAVGDSEGTPFSKIYVYAHLIF
jgi:hypothetical protein